MIGRLADLLRLAWGLLYWNIRKSLFQLRRGQSSCPCQSPSDSGRAYQTACDACLSWDKPARFRRVCPLLVQTPDGLRCSVDTEHVRPFWGRAFAIYGGTALSIYLAGAIAIFAFLRSVGYPINIGHLIWPGKWHRVTEVRGWFFMERANRAFTAGRTAEGMLYLTNAYEFDPNNFDIAFTLAQKLQFGQPGRADQIYRRLLETHPAQAPAVSEAWFRALLARGDFPTIVDFASQQVLKDESRGGVWLRALIFASRQLNTDTALRDLLTSSEPAAQRWRLVLETELLLRENRRDAARATLNRPWSDAPPFALFYQVNELSALGEGIAASDFVAQYSARLDDVARVTLLLDLYARMGAQQSRQRLVSVLIANRLNPSVVALLAAHLIRHPHPQILEQVFSKFSREQIALDDDTLDAFLALYCAAGVARDNAKMHLIASFLAKHGDGSKFTLGLAGAFFRGDTPLTRVTAILPALPVPLEVNYALLERFPGPRIQYTGGTP